MQALERTYFNDHWITIVLVFLLAAVFFLKVLDAKKLIGYAFSFFSKTFIEDEIEEDTSFLNLFHNIIFLFSITVFSVIIYLIIVNFNISIAEGFLTFVYIFLAVFIYITFKWFLEYGFSLIFLIKKPIKFFLLSKTSYLYSVSFYLFIAVILVQYSQLNPISLIYISTVFFLIRFLLHLINNKKLIFSKLFYFILYLCAFEIAPLLILFKLMF